MTLAQLETLVWSWLDDPNGTYFTQSQVDVWLNNAMNEVQKLLIQAGENYYVQKLSGVTVANSDTYSLPSDFRKCHKLEVVISGTGVNEVRQTLTPVTLIQIDQISTGTGLPAAYAIKRSSFILRPIPDAVYTVYMHQSYRVVPMTTGSDIPDVPADYHEFIAVLATIDGLMKDQRDPSAFISAKRDYYLSLLKQDAENRDVSAPRSIVVTDNYSYGMY